MKKPRPTATERSAEEKLELITPLLLPGQERKLSIQLRKEIAEREGLSYRTVGRYLDAWREKGFEGLKPKPSWNRGKSGADGRSEELLQEAIALRRECPGRSVKDIILILELEGRVRPGTLRRSTLQSWLQAAGHSARQVRQGAAKGRSSRRFQKSHRNELWQSDIKYGPYLPIGEKGEMKQVYLCVFLDDCTRFIVSAGFYEKQDSDMIEDCLRQAIMRYGKPDTLYVDNGKQYGTRWLENACRKLDVLLLHTKPYDPEAKGKVEAFNRRAGAFLSEAALERPQTLGELNRHLENWIEEYYHKSEHRSLGEVSPRTAFTLDTRPLAFVDHEKLREAFLHTEERQADKTGCVSFNGKLFEAGMRFAGRKVTVVYDPAFLDEIEIRMKDAEPATAHPVTIGPFCGYVRDGGGAEDPVPADSRLLKALSQAHAARRTSAGIATSFRKTRGMEAGSDV